MLLRQSLIPVKHTGVVWAKPSMLQKQECFNLKTGWAFSKKIAAFLALMLFCATTAMLKARWGPDPADQGIIKGS